MKAVIYPKYGPPDVLELVDIPTPTPKADEVLLKVYATTANRTDCGFRSAEYVISRLFSGLLKPKLNILGSEFAGEIVAIGAAVTQYKVGDKIFGFNDKTFGAYAEYMVLKESDAFAHIPDGLSYYEAAPIAEGSHYALCDIRAAKVVAGQNILVNGATGAIGSAAIQILKHMGCSVTAVCHSKHIDLVKTLGPDEVIAYDKQDFTQLNKQFDFVFDAVGKSRFTYCKAILKPQGIYISTELGPRWENIFLALKPAFGGKRLLFPLPTSSKADIEYLGNLVAAGKFKPLIDREYPLAQMADAHRYAETGMKTGNIIIRVA